MTIPKWIDRTCSICGNEDQERYQIRYKRPFEILKCLNCDLVFVNQRLTRPIVNEYPIEHFLTNENILVDKAKRNFQYLVKLVNKFSSGKGKEKIILDMGCGLGYFLRIAQCHHWLPYGLEINQRAAVYARKHYRLDVKVGNIEEKTEFHAESFDVITMFGVIEHLVNPSEAIKECYRLLKRDGILSLQTPTEDGLFRKFGNILYKISFEKIEFHVRHLYSPGGHNLCFSRNSIRLLLEQNNFQIMKIVGSTYGLKILLKRFNLNSGGAIYILGTFLLYLLARLIAMPNHMTVYAQKKEA